MNALFLILGIGCILYYFACGIGVRFGQSMLWIWPVVGAFCLLRFAVVQVSISRGVALPYPVWLIRSFRILCCMLLAVFVTVEGFVISGFFAKCPANVDYLIVLGAKTGSVSIEGRINTAAAYLKENPETRAIVSGGQGRDEEMSEGEYMRQGLIARGITPERILVEDQAKSTWENIRFSLDLLEKETGTRPAKLGVVSSEYHLFRASLFAKNAGVEFVGIPAKTSRLGQKINHFMREVAGVWHYILLGGNYDA